MFDTQVIQHFIPHRHPFLLIDEITAFTAFETATSTFRLESDAWYFKGHFPHNPIFPGVLSLEVMAQTASFLVAYSLQLAWGDKNVYLMSMDQAKFRHMAKPGDILTCHVKIERRKDPIWKVYGEIYIEDKLACSTYLMAAMAE